MKRSVIEWEGNMPVVVSRETFPVAQLSTVTENILAEAFEDPLGLWPEYVGLSNGEVVMRQLIRRATFGCKDATKELLDRIVGKPKQQIETKKLSMTYKDYLDELNRNTIDVPPAITE